MRKRSSWLILFLVVWLSAMAHSQTKVVQGPQGPRGFTGARGPAATIQIGTVTVVDANTPPTVVNVGTSSNAILNFTIPRGGQLLSGAGAPSTGGAAGDWWFDTTNACLYGPKTTVWPGSCTNLGTTIAVGTTTTLPSGSSATVNNSGSSGHAVLNFGIPKGDQGDPGDTGPQGPSGTASVGSVTTLPAGSMATVANSGTPSAAVFDFGIPTGPQGPQGPPGGALTGLSDVTTTIQAAVDAACAASPKLAVHIPGNWDKNETFTNNCGVYVWDQRSIYAQADGSANVRNFGADGAGNGYVDMITNVASKNVTGCYNMTASMVVGKYLHVLRAGPSGGIFKSKITAFSGITCTVADFPSASVTAGGWVSSNDDDGVAINAAIQKVTNDGVQNQGGKIIIPPGNYFINIDNSPIVLPIMQSTAPLWNIGGIEISCPGGPLTTRLYGVSNKIANGGPPHAIIEGPRTTATITAWSQSGTTVTLTANNTFSNGDFLSVWVPSGVGTINGDWVISTRTATTITFTANNSTTASFTETGSVWRAEKPMTPWIHGCDFETLDYPYGAKTGTALLDGIDMKAYVFKVDDNYFGQLDEGIRMYRSWLGSIINNRFYGPNIGIHFPKSLGPINAVAVERNWFDLYGQYGIFAEANQEGGSFENSYRFNEMEGTSAKTIADIRINGGGLMFQGGYTENAGSLEADYHQLVIDGYGNFLLNFPLCIKQSGNTPSTFTIQQGGFGACGWDHVGLPTASVSSGAGTFPAGRDVYIKITYKNTVDGYESNMVPYSSGVKITNTSLNDRVVVHMPTWADALAKWTQYCVYEADVATGSGAPLNIAYKALGTCTNMGTDTNVDASTSGTALKPFGYGLDSGLGNLVIGVDGGGNYGQGGWDRSCLFIDPTTNAGVANNFSGWYACASAYIGRNVLYMYAGGLRFYSHDVNSDFAWSYAPRVDISGWTLGLANSNDHDTPSNNFGTRARVPAWALIKNRTPAQNYGYNNELFWVCINGNGCATSTVATDWAHWGDMHQRIHGEYTNPRTDVAFTAGDWVWNKSGSKTGTYGGVVGWYALQSATSAGTQYPVYAGQGGYTVVTYSATPTYDASIATNFKITLTGGISSATLNYPIPGQTYTFTYCQGLAGGYTITWPTGFLGGGQPNPKLGVCSTQRFNYDGTNARASGPMVDDAGGKTLATGASFGLNSVTFSATPMFDASAANTFKITLTGNVTSSTLTNATAGQPLNFIICLDAVGSETFSWPAGFKGAMTIGTTASKCNAQSFVWDGTNAWATSQGQLNQ